MNNEEMPAPIDDDLPAKNSFHTEKTDPGFLVAKGKFFGSEKEQKDKEKIHVKKLASAIFMACTNHGYATIRTVGPFASYNASRAIAIASGYCALKGIELCFNVHFDEGNLGQIRQEGHVENVNALKYSVKGFREWSEKVDKGKDKGEENG
jgi:stage V sporulation protein SpoVS